MPYTIKTVDVGEYKTTYIYCERPVATARGKKVKATSDLQDKLNERMSEAAFRDIVHLNFTNNDFAVRLDYARFIRKNERNPTVEEAQTRMRYFIRKLRKIYSALNINLDYVYVTEVGKIKKKIHHHMVLRGSQEPEVTDYLYRQIKKIWPYGFTHKDELEFSEYGVKGLVHYFIKNPSTCHRWACSLGLKRPTEENGMVRRHRSAISAKAAKYIDEHPFDSDFIVKHALGKGWVPSQVRVTSVSSGEDARPYDIPGVTDPSINVYDGYVRPDYGGCFIEIWSYKEGTDLFVPIGQDKRVRKVSKTKDKA